MIKFILVFVLMGAISGCAGKFSCGQFPRSGCQPVSSVYSKTNGELNDYRVGMNSKKASNRVNRHGRGSRKVNDTHVHVGVAQNAINKVIPGEVILTRPVVMRVLLNSFEDKEKDLNSGGFIYVRLRDSEWKLNGN